MHYIKQSSLKWFFLYVWVDISFVLDFKLNKKTVKSKLFMWINNMSYANLTTIHQHPYIYNVQYSVAIFFQLSIFSFSFLNALQSTSADNMNVLNSDENNIFYSKCLQFAHNSTKRNETEIGAHKTDHQVQEYSPITITQNAIHICYTQSEAKKHKKVKRNVMKPKAVKTGKSKWKIPH